MVGQQFHAIHDLLIFGRPIFNDFHDFFFSANINWIDYPTHVEARSIRHIAPQFWAFPWRGNMWTSSSCCAWTSVALRWMHEGNNWWLVDVFPLPRGPFQVPYIFLENKTNKSWYDWRWTYEAYLQHIWIICNLLISNGSAQFANLTKLMDIAFDCRHEAIFPDRE